MSCRSLLVAALVAIVVATGLAAQSTAPQKPPQEPRPTFRTEANFVRVDVYPMHDGVPVQDLRAEEFEILEDGVPQTIESFEHVVVRPAGPQDQRAEPNTIEASRQLAANPRNRVFIIFLDVPHVTMDGSWHVREPLIRLMDRILGPDDLIGVMTPNMAASDLVLGRKTEVIAGGLRDKWPWGERFTLERSDREREYVQCYPLTDAEKRQGKTESDLAKELIARRRERAVLDSLKELVGYLRGVREERKAILTVTEGWWLYRPDESLTNLRKLGPDRQDPVPGVDPITVGPDGRITVRGDPGNYNSDLSKMECDKDRMQLAFMDNWRYFRDLMDDANRGNASFYTIDPRGLAAFDAPIGPDAPPPARVDLDNLRHRQDTMRVLADNTDGMAVIGNNDLDVGFKRIAADLTSYYLIGYYSKNTKLDGRFRTIKVSVTRPGVQVRARKGYRAATAAEVSAARKAAAPPVPARVSSVAAAVASLERIRADGRLHVHAVPGAAGASGISRLWVAGELTSAPGAEPWSGGTARIEVSGGGASGSATVTLGAADRAFLAPIDLTQAVLSGALNVRVRLAGSGGAERPSDTVSVPVAPRAAAPLVFRRGPTTGNKLQAVATFQFSRTDRAHLELPIALVDKPGASRLLDRSGQPLGVPVTVGERTDAEGGQRWLTADLTLAPLAPGDYVVEMVVTGPAGEERVLTPLRVVR